VLEISEFISYSMPPQNGGVNLTECIRLVNEQETLPRH
jgi:hypothetical protein